MSGSVSRTNRSESYTAGVPSGSTGQLPSPYLSTSTKLRRCTDSSPVIKKSSKPSANSSSASPNKQPQANAVVPKKCYIVGTMNRCGSIFEEMGRQLIASGRWTEVRVKKRPTIKTLYVSDTQQDLSSANIHLMLGEKVPMENLINQRRQLMARYKTRSTSSATTKGNQTIRSSPATARVGPIRLPMGGNQNEVRVIDFIEGTRCITLKSKMVSTLLQHHNHNWVELGKYLPMTFLLSPGDSGLRDERNKLLESSLNKSMWKNGNAPLWIAKSSSGSHGDNIEIFKGDRTGVQRLLNFVDKQKGASWVAQQYIDRPLLYHKRKFDIRCFALLMRDSFDIYVHDELIMRMSSVAYDRESATGKGKEGRLAHITNHCVQSEAENYSKYEEGNELWREHLDGLIRYKGSRLSKGKNAAHNGSPDRTVIKSVPASAHRNTSHPCSLSNSPVRVSREESRSPKVYPGPNHNNNHNEVTLRSHIMPQMYHIVKETILAARPHLPKEPTVPSPTQCFQVFGYDFIIDENLCTWLLEINGAPGGADRVVPKIMKDTIEIAVNSFFPLNMSVSKNAVSPDNGYVKVYPPSK